MKTFAAVMIIGYGVAAMLVGACAGSPTAPSGTCAKLMDSTTADWGQPSSVIAKSATDQVWVYGPNSGGAFTYFEFTWPPCVRTGPTMAQP